MFRLKKKLTDNGYFAYYSFVSFAGGCMDHIHTAGYALTILIATVPLVRTAVGAPFIHYDSVRGGDFHLSIVSKAGDGDISRVVGFHRVRISPNIVLGHFGVGFGGIADA